MIDYSLETLVLKHYSKLMNLANHKAFTFNINRADFQSMINLKLSVAISNGLFNGESEEQFWAYIHMMIHNAAICVTRNNKFNACLDIDEISESHLMAVVKQPNLAMKEFAKMLTQSFETDKSKNYSRVFKSYFIEGNKYEEVAKELNIPMGTVKTIIWKIREKANKNYGKEYQYLMAS